MAEKFGKVKNTPSSLSRANDEEENDTGHRIRGPDDLDGTVDPSVLLRGAGPPPAPIPPTNSLRRANQSQSFGVRNVRPSSAPSTANQEMLNSIDDVDDYVAFVGVVKNAELCDCKRQESESDDENDESTESEGAACRLRSSKAITQRDGSLGSCYNWQANKITVKDRLSYIFNSEVLADVHFLVGRNHQRFPAHKFILSIGSAVFDAMFNGGMATTSAEVDLPDVEPAAFLALMKFLYEDEVHIDPETVMTTLYTAKKYAVPALEQACVEFLKRNLNSENAFMLLTQARLFDEPQLADLCLETIDKNTTDALKAEGFTDIDLETLIIVIKRDTLGIKECKLFEAVCRWAETECLRQNVVVNSENKRGFLGPALSLVRFPLMTIEEFASGPAQSGILTDRESVQLFLYYTLNPKPSIGFADTPRCCLTGREQVVSRFCHIESRWGYSGTSDRIRFVVNKKIHVVGFGLYGSIHGPAEYTVNIQVIQSDSSKMCGQNETSFQCDGSQSTFRVMFKEPVEIQPNINYTASSTLKGPDSYYGSKGMRKVSHNSSSSGRITFHFTYAAGNNNGTSVEDGQIPEIIFYT